MIKKRMLSLLMALVLLLSLLPVDARADAGYTFDKNTRVLTITASDTFTSFGAGSDDDDAAAYAALGANVVSVVIAASADSGAGEETFGLIGLFAGFPNLASFEVESGNKYYLAQDGVLYGKLASDKLQLICYPPQKAGDVFVIPNNVTLIAETAFSEGVLARIKLYASKDTIDKLNKADNQRYNVLNIEDLATENVIPVESLKLSEDALTLDTDASFQLSATVLPENATVKYVTWSSTDESIATVDAYGLVTAVSPGTATITATSDGLTHDDKRVSAECSVTVKTPVTMTIPDGTPGAAGEQIEVDTNAGECTRLSVSINADATDNEIGWAVTKGTAATLGAPVETKANDLKTSTVTVTPSDTGEVTVTASAGTQTKTFHLNLTKWVHSVTLPATVILPADGTRNLTETLTFAPDDPSNKAVAWSSSDNSIATVDENGVVTAVSPGTATITVKSEDQKAAGAGEEIKAECTVKVRSIMLNHSEIELKQHGTVQLSATILPNDAPQTVTWTSSDPTVAKVDQTTGLVEVLASTGTATITATSSESDQITASCVITATELPVNGVTLSTSDDPLTIKLGEEKTLTATIDPANATNRKLSWQSTYPDVVSISSPNGSALSNIVTADENGQYTIRLKAEAEGRADIIVNVEGSGKSAILHVLVPTSTKELALSESTLTLGPNGSKQLLPVFTPAAPTNPELEWTSSDTNVVTVDGNGVVTAAVSAFEANEASTAHTAVVTAKTTDGSNLTAQCTVTVQRNKVTNVRLDQATLALGLTDADQKTATLVATVEPANATIPGVAWSTSDKNVATVDQSGKVSAVAPGTATITATTDDLGYTARCTVTVAKTRVTGLTLSADGLSADGKLTLAENGSRTLTATIEPGGATDRVILWKSSNESIATVSPAQTTANTATNGTSITATAKGTGSVTITATAHDNETIVAECTVNIPATSVTSVVLNQHTVTLELGGTPQAPAVGTVALTATVNPSNATFKGVAWRSGDESIATVDQNGTVTAKKSGSTIIYAISEDGSKEDRCTVNVRWKTTGVEMDKDETTIIKGGTEQLNATIKPDSANLTLEWTSEKTSVATVDQNGKVTAVALGEAVIKAKAKSTDDSDIGDYFATCTVTVIQPATSISLNKPITTLSVEGTDALTATVGPEDATDEITWSSSNVNIATVAQGNDKKTATVTAVSGGTAVITVKAGNQTATCTVNVNTAVTGVSLNKTAVSLGIGETEPLTPIFEPYNATNRNVTWEVAEGGDYIDVSDAGVITAKAVGTAKVTVTTADGGKTATCTVRVVPTPVTGVQLSGTGFADGKLTMDMTDAKKTATLTATITPKEATDKTLTWESSDTDVVTVSSANDTADDDGRSTVTLNAVHPGTAVVTVTTTSGGHRAVCYVTVEKTAVQSVSIAATGLSDKKLTVNLNATAALTGTITPGTATYQDLIWAVGDSSVAELNNYATASGGTVTLTAKKAGTTTVTLTAKDDGSKTDSITVVVPSTPVQTLTIAPASVELIHSREQLLTAIITPDGATSKAITWRSSNESVAKVEPVSDNTAKVITQGYGSTVITAAANDGSGKSATCEVTVYLPVTGVTMKESTTLTIGTNATETLIATVNPMPGAKQDVTWMSSNDAVVTVDGGVISAAGPGTAVVTATATGTGYHADCTVTVTQPTGSVTVAPSSKELKLNGEAGEDTVSLQATLNPSNASAAVTWSSDNKSVATVDENGVVAAVGPGSATITASSGGKIGTCVITVVMLASGVTMGKKTLTLEEGENATLTATVAPSNTTDKTLAWSVSAQTPVNNGDTVATVDQTGKVTAVKAGSATVAVTINGHTDTCAVTVKPISVKSIVISPNPANVEFGRTLQLNATVGPDAAANKVVKWSSSDVNVAAIDEDSGLVTAKAVGTTTITAAAKDGSGVKDTCTVTVNAVGATSVSVASSMALYLNGDEVSYKSTGTLTATLQPSNTTDTVAWSSSNTGVATLTPNGNGSVSVTAVGNGSAIISAISDSKKIGQCTVTVKTLATGLTLSPATVEAGKPVTLTPVFEPSNVSSRELVWSSSDETIAKVNGGVVETYKDGSVTITAAARDGSGREATCTVTVTKVAVTGVSLSPKQLTLCEGESATLTPTISPSNAANKGVTWSSDNEDAATVDESGKVTAVAAKADGNVDTATITVTTEDGEKTDVCYVTVQPTAVTGLTLSQTSLTIAYSARSSTHPKLTATVAPSTASNKNVAWTSSDLSVVTVAADGTVTAKAPGTATITARSASNSSIAATCDVEVTWEKVTGVSLNVSLLQMIPAEEQTLVETVAPSGADIKAVMWSSSNTAVATVDSNGKVTAVAAGTAVITVMTDDQSKTAVCVVQVWNKVTGVTLNKTEFPLGVGDSEVLTATVEPSAAANKNVKWTSDHPEIATVDAAGRVTAVAAGKATITVTTEDQNKSTTCTVTVSDVKVTGITLSQTELTLMKNEEKPLTAAVAPANATNKGVTWESNETSVAEVDTTGKITAKSPGTATITATAADGSGKKATCSVTVRVPVTALTLEPTSKELEITNDVPEPQVTLTATVEPAGQVDDRVTWSSSNNEVATVVDGVVTAHKTGSALITAVSAANPLAQRSCTVTVVRHTTGIALAPDTLSFDLSTNARSNTLVATLTPSGTTDDVTWSITPGDDVVQLSAASNANGRSTVTVYALKEGNATITVTSGKDGDKKAATCNVTVTNPATGLLLDQAELKLDKGGTKKLNATILGGSDAVTISWITSDNTVATVSDGTVTASNTKSGTATITASITINGTPYSKTCEVTVNPTLVSGITLKKDGNTVTELALYPNSTATLTAAVEPDGADLKTVTWSSSNTNVATVDSSGVISAAAVGTTIITATADDAGGKTATCLVTVSPIAVSSISLDKTTLSLNENENGQLTVTFDPTNATNQNVRWYSSNDTVATVDASGLVTAVKAGSATITAVSEADNTKTAACAVTVTAPVTGVTLNKTELGLTVGGTETLIATVEPANASNPNVTWSSDDTNVAKVNASTGEVTAVAVGTATITATTADGNKTKTCAVTVTAQVVSVTGVTIRKDNADVAETLALAIGDAPVQLTAAVAPDGATNKAVTWSSSNSNVASVENGLVTPKAPGTAAIIVTTAEGGKTAACTVTVTRKANGVTISPTSLSLAVNTIGELTATVTAADGSPSDTSVTWTSGDDSIATVSASGIVRGIAEGSTTIKATAKDGSGMNATCNVTVTVPLTGVTIKKGEDAIVSLELDLLTTKTATLTAVPAPVGAAGVTYSWSSGNTSVVTVNEDGVLTAIGAGTTSVTVTATAGGASVSKTCTVTVAKAELDLSGLQTSLRLLPGSTSETVVFGPCEIDTVITWTGTNDGVVRQESSFADGKQTYTFTALKNGIVTLNWSKAEDAKTKAAIGTLTIYSLPEPLTSVTFPNLPSGSSLTADISGSTIRVAGYVPETASYTLGNKISCKTADDVIGPLSAAWESPNKVVVKHDGTLIRTYNVDRSGMVSLSSAVDVSATAMLVAPAGTSVEGVILNSVDNLKEAAISEINKISGLEDATSANTEITIEPLSQTTGRLGDTQTITLDVTPSYTVTKQDGTTVTGKLEKVSASVTIEVMVRFRPELIVHDHNGTLEYPVFTCTGPDGSGYYTVSWRQSSFSEVMLLAKEAAEEFLASLPEPGSGSESEPQPSYPVYPVVPSTGDNTGKPTEPTEPESKPTEETPTKPTPADPKPVEPVPAAKVFADVPAPYWAAEAIAYVTARGIFNGVSSDQFAPSLAMSRAMTAQMLYNFDDGDKSVSMPSFPDAAGRWFDTPSRWAAGIGVVKGVDDSFVGDMDVSREQMAVMLYRYAQHKGYDTTFDADALSAFADAASVGSWAREAMCWAVSHGLISGTDHGLDPKGGATRAQVATIMMRFCENIVSERVA